MRFKEVLFTALLLPVPLLGGCGHEGDVQGEGETPSTQHPVTDDAGRTWTFEAPPTRILSLVPAGTDLLITLGLGDRLVGRTDFDVLPPELSHLPSVGGGLGPNLEAVVALNPDLVIRFEGPSDPETPARLDQLGIPHLGIRPDGIADILRITRLIGTVTDREEAARALEEALTTSLEEVRARVAPLPRIPVAILLGGDPPWAAGESSFIHELVTLAGGDNVLAGATPLYAPISVEEVRRRAPALLILTGSGRVPVGLQGIPYRMAPDILVIPGPRLADAAAAMAALLHPSLDNGSP